MDTEEIVGAEVVPFFVFVHNEKRGDYFVASIQPPIDGIEAQESLDPHRAVAHCFEELAKWYEKQAREKKPDGSDGC